jgi:hypothetical protein
MDYREQLFRPLSKRFIDHLVLEIFAHPTDFQIVYNLIFDSEKNIAWRAAWACQKISEKYPEWFNEGQFLQLAELTMHTKHGGLKRGCLSVLNNLSLPNQIPIELINACFDWMISPKCPIAVQALSMKFLNRICLTEPDLQSELMVYLENINYEDFSPGFNSTRNNILKALKNKKFDY